MLKPSVPRVSVSPLPYLFLPPSLPPSLLSLPLLFFPAFRPSVGSALHAAQGSQSNERGRQRGSDINVMSNKVEGTQVALEP